MIPALFFFDFEIGLVRFMNVAYMFHIIYLGVGASALCFVTWNFAVQVLGAVRTSIYIYMVPVITIAASIMILHEPLTCILAVGALLVMAGLFLSEYHPKDKRK